MYLNYKALLILIDNQKGSIVNSSDIYGTQKCLNVENVHLHFCTHILDVRNSICTATVYAEPGRTPLFYHIQFALNKYWRKSMDCNMTNCLMMKNNWVSDVKHCLIDESFKIIWNLQGYKDVIK